VVTNVYVTGAGHTQSARRDPSIGAGWLNNKLGERGVGKDIQEIAAALAAFVADLEPYTIGTSLMPRTLFVSVVVASLFVVASLACSGLVKPGKSDPVAEEKSDPPENAKQDKPTPQPRELPIPPGGGNERDPKQPKPPDQKPVEVARIDSFLGISSDFKVYAVCSHSQRPIPRSLDVDGVKIVDLETGKNLTSLKWDQDWGPPYSAAIGTDVIAVVTMMDFARSIQAVKVFSRKTGGLEQNIHGYQFEHVAFTADGRFLAFIEFRHIQGYYFVLRDIQGKKTVAEVSLGTNGSYSLAVTGTRVATFTKHADRITVVEVDTGVAKIECTSFRERKGFGGSLTPVAISPAGNLIACKAKDDIVLYDIASEQVTHKLEGHLDTVQAIAFSPNGEIVASAAKDKTIRFWNVKQGKEVYIIKNLPTSPMEIIYSTDGKRIAIAYPGESVKPRKAEILSVNLE
jgi:hypothetical protein